MKKMNLFTRLAITFLFAMISFACPQPIPEPIPSKKKAPDTEITTEFPGDGNVKYTLKGTPDGSIDYISASINGGASQDYPNNTTIPVLINEGINKIKGTAYDDEGGEDESPATYSFNSPTEGEASELIETTLNPSTYNKLEKNARLSPGNEPEFYVNALIKRLDDKDAVIDYLPNEQIPGILKTYGIHDLCIMDRTSEGKLVEKVLEFQNGGYE
jgi:hypothetical protein